MKAIDQELPDFVQPSSSATKDALTQTFVQERPDIDQIDRELIEQDANWLADLRRTHANEDVQAENIDPKAAAVALLSAGWCERNHILPVSLDRRKLVVQHYHASDWLKSAIRRRTGLKDVTIEVKHSQKTLVEMIKQESWTRQDEQLSTIERYFKETILQAGQMRASDVLFEPNDESVVVRYMVDGIPKLMDRLPHDFWHNLRGLIGNKYIMHFDPTIGQGGHGTIKGDGRLVDFRVQSWPRKIRTRSEPKFILRIHQPYYLMQQFDELGMSPEQQDAFLAGMSAHKAAVLLCGEPGSGKSTTIYAALRHLAPHENNVYAIEDPVEIYVPWLWQTEIVDGRWTHEMAARAILRSTPSFVFVGETLDQKSAVACLNMMLTSVPSATSLHASTPAQALSRLVHEFGISPQRLSESVTCMAAQMLYNPVCQQCREEVEPSNQLRHLLDKFGIQGLTPKKVSRASEHPKKDCDECFGSGFVSPRMALFEVVEMSKKLRDTLEETSGSVSKLMDVCYSKKNPPMFVEAVRMLREGTMDERTFMRKVPQPFMTDVLTWF
jgi:type IV pilus assembly protein PilB